MIAIKKQNNTILKDILKYPLKREINKIILHHSWSLDNKYLNWEAIKTYHIYTNGWSDIGYHFGIENINNNIHLLNGRNMNKIGAHVKKNNHDSIGICIVGNYDRFEVSYKKIYLLSHLLNVLLYKTKLDIYSIHPHWIYDEIKSCPGRKFDFNFLRNIIRQEKDIVNILLKEIDNEKKNN